MARSYLLVTFHLEGHRLVVANNTTKSVEMRQVNQLKKKKRHLKKVNYSYRQCQQENHEHGLFSIQIRLWVYFVREFGHSPNEIRLWVFISGIKGSFGV